MATGTSGSTPERASETFLTASRALVGMALRSLTAAPVEITLPQHRVLVLLAAGGPQTIGRLAELLGIDQSNASRLCDRLQNLGLIVRRRSIADGRAVDVHLAPPAHELLAAVNEHRRREIEQVLAGIPARQVEAAVKGLDAFNRAADEAAAQDWSVHAV